ncbi:ComEA family DNA-binding protein [Bifidobacterium criceti]|uniref:ComEA family DNA-binding protein n=1 Tax=Bifidobacterium criceti TaxID=1960969 RepID=UPI0012FF9F57|nr:helix-hairpin-helix domain-containing protein [Bifidobacterium criceti]
MKADDAKALLAGLTGVQGGDDGPQDAIRDKPRLSIEPVHALIIMGILVTLLAASLTLLVEQSVNLAAAPDRAEGQAPTGTAETREPVTGVDGDAGTATAEAQPDGQPQGTASDTQTQPQPDAQPQPAPQTPSTPQLIDLNTATQEQLETVKGIGPVTAANIISYRLSVGRLTSVDDLLNVNGIGIKTLDKIRGQVTVR